jgi:thymidylate synthase (FAD)
METKLNVMLLAYTPDPERACASAARQCYSDVGVKELKERMSDEQVKALLDQVIKSGHTSTLEHATFTFGIEGISRACSHQLVRHRIASYSQQSQRYVNAKNFNYLIPESIKSKPELKKKFEDFIKIASKTYTELSDSGISNEDARFVLPNACETKIVVTMNSRALLNFFKERTCVRAQWEIRALAVRMLEECKKVAPNIFKYAGPSCVAEKVCRQGKRSCGKWKLIEGARLES